MSDPLATNLLALPYIAAAQAQKHVTHNEALRLLDGIVQLAVESAALSTPPSTPAEGDRYLVAAAPTGDWAGHAGDLAIRADGAWLFATPRPGWIAYDKATDSVLILKAGGWTAI